MPVVNGYKIVGSLLKAFRQSQLRKTQPALAEIMDLNERSIRAYEKSAVANVPGEAFERLAAHAGKSPIELFRMMAAPGELESAQNWWQLGLSDATHIRAADGMTSEAEVENVEPYSETTLVAEIPFFDLPIAAGGWTQVTDNEDGGYRLTTAQKQQGLFRVRVRGDSMMPKYPDGTIVEFKMLLTSDGMRDCTKLEIGKRYYVQLDDGMGTFKQLADCTREGLALLATNRAYKKKLLAPFDRITRLAVAVARVDLDD